MDTSQERIVLPIGFLMRSINAYLEHAGREERLVSVQAHGENLAIRLNKGEVVCENPRLKDCRVTARVTSLAWHTITVQLDSLAGRIAWKQLTQRLAQVPGLSVQGGLVEFDLRPRWPAWLPKAAAKLRVDGMEIVIVVEG